MKAVRNLKSISLPAVHCSEIIVKQIIVQKLSHRISCIGRRGLEGHLLLLLHGAINSSMLLLLQMGADECGCSQEPVHIVHNVHTLCLRCVN